MSVSGAIVWIIRILIYQFIYILGSIIYKLTKITVLENGIEIMIWANKALDFTTRYSLASSHGDETTLRKLECEPKHLEGEADYIWG